MFIDASALTAILIDEPDSDIFAMSVRDARTRITSALAVWETVVAVARALDLPVAKAQLRVEGYLGLADIDVVALPPEAASRAIEAFDRFGKGRHPAALNMGDCFAYAGARLARMPLLYKGKDFALTDIEAA